MVRVRKVTRERLRKLQQALDKAMELRPDIAELGRWDEITVDQAITVLLNRDDGHRKRGRKRSKRVKPLPSPIEVISVDTAK